MKTEAGRERLREAADRVSRFLADHVRAGDQRAAQEESGQAGAPQVGPPTDFIPFEQSSVEAASAAETSAEAVAESSSDSRVPIAGVEPQEPSRAHELFHDEPTGGMDVDIVAELSLVSGRPSSSIRGAC